jgi:hypothetical protein
LIQDCTRTVEILWDFCSHYQGKANQCKSLECL